MKKEQTDRTIELIAEYLEKMGLQFPLRSMDDIEIINDFFSDLEVELAQAADAGESVDSELLVDVSRAFDDTALYEPDDYVDLDELNDRLGRK
jgi:hypothetical protein